MHTIDIVRRDAIEQRLWFEITLSNDNHNVTITLTGQRDDTYPEFTMVYTINLEKDIVEEIAFISPQSGELKFTYDESIDQADTEFTEPLPSLDASQSEPSDNPGILWLRQLAGGNLG